MGFSLKNNHENGQDESSANKRSRRTILILLLLLLLLLLRQCGDRGPTTVAAGDLFPEGGVAVDGFLSGMTKEEIMEQMQKIADASQFSFKINARPVFADGKSAGNLRIENPNYNIYPMVVQITLDDTGEIIYDSGGILPNQYIENAKLLKVLSSGTHEATANLFAYDPDTLVCQGQAAVKLVISVKN